MLYYQTQNGSLKILQMQNCKHVAPIHYVASRQYRTKITEKPKSDTPDLDREVS